MKDILEQWTKAMGKMWDPWQKMMGDVDWMKGAQGTYPMKWSAWLAAVRSSLDVNASWWQMFIDQTEEVFFKTFKESPFYSKSVEDQMREFGASVRKAQAMQQDSAREYLDKMEALLKERDETR
jgi:hypothetical protein